jgi:hypothetical protein
LKDLLKTKERLRFAAKGRKELAVVAAGARPRNQHTYSRGRGPRRTITIVIFTRSRFIPGDGIGPVTQATVRTLEATGVKFD